MTRTEAQQKVDSLLETASRLAKMDDPDACTGLQKKLEEETDEITGLLARVPDDPPTADCPAGFLIGRLRFPAEGA